MVKSSKVLDRHRRAIARESERPREFGRAIAEPQGKYEKSKEP